MKQGSNLTSPVGLCVLAVLTGAAAYFRIPALEAFLAAVLLLAAAAFVWGRRALKKLRVELHGGDRCGFPGEILEAEGSVCNQKLLPLVWLELRWPGAAARGLAPAEPETENADDGTASELTENFAWLMPHQTLHWKQRALAVRRGAYPLRRVALCSGDGFGLSVHSETVRAEGGARFVVYPALIPVEPGALMRVLRELERAKNGMFTDRTLLAAVRDWREGDSYRDINWRVLARTDEVQVNVREKLDARRLCLVPDLDSFSKLEEKTVDGVVKQVRRADGEALERMLSLAASLVTELGRREVLCTMIVPAYGRTAARVVIPEQREGQETLLLTALAEIDYDGQEVTLPFAEIQEQHHLLGQVFVLSRSMERAAWHDDPAAAEALGLLRILQEAPAEGGASEGIFTETELCAV